jgi:hypothetical protein
MLMAKVQLALARTVLREPTASTVQALGGHELENLEKLHANPARQSLHARIALLSCMPLKKPLLAAAAPCMTCT